MKLIGEYDTNGNVISEHIYFGLRPVGLYKNNQIMTVHTDYLGTPREIKSGNSTVWKWENKDIFGANLPSLETIEYNLRFSGQYFDKENKLHYNINRTYNPKFGRYMQSDPLGLADGFNTYNYVDGNPLNSIDTLGLDGVKMPRADSTDGIYVRSLWRMEEMQKSVVMDADKETLYVLSHASPITMSGMNADVWTDMLYSGVIKDSEHNFIQNSSYISRRLKEGKDINIFLNACNTGSPYFENGIQKANFGTELANGLRKKLDAAGYNHIKVNVTAPSGFSYWPGNFIPWSRSPKADWLKPMYIKETGQISANKLEDYRR